MTLRPNEIVRLQMAVAATGNGNVMNVNGLGTVAFQVSGTFVATVTFEGTIDGSNWVSLQVSPQAGGSGTATATTTGVWVGACTGLAQVRARVTWTSGTSVTVIGMAVDTGGGAGGGSTVQGNAASGATDSGNPVKVGGVYNSAAPTLTSGQRGDMQLDVNGNLKVTQATLMAGEDQTNNVLGILAKPVASATYAPSTYKDAGSVTKANIKATPGNVYSLRITNANAAVRYLQLHNKASAPAAAETAQLFFLIPAGTALQPAVVELDSTFFAPSEFFATGIGWAISTTATTFTDSATAADHNIMVRYV